jgi:O-antigen ligase
MSLFMVVTIAGLVVLYLRGRLKLGKLLLGAVLLFAPTLVNETKATVLLLPIALLLPVLLMPGKARVLRRVMPLIAIGAVAMVAFVGAYNYFIQYRKYPSPIEDFFTSETLRSYVYTGAANSDQPYIGRFDSIEIALEHISTDPFKLAFGYGAGNVTESFLPQFNGEYADYYQRFGIGQTQITQFLWEIGLVGTAAFLFLYYVVARDSLFLARSKDSSAPLGQFWAVVVVIMTFGLLYKSLLSMNDSGYLFWYFSGLVAGRAAALRQSVAVRGAPQRIPPSWRLAVEGPRAPAKG